MIAVNSDISSERTKKRLLKLVGGAGGGVGEMYGCCMLFFPHSLPCIHCFPMCFSGKIHHRCSMFKKDDDDCVDRDEGDDESETNQVL